MKLWEEEKLKANKKCTDQASPSVFSSHELLNLSGFIVVAYLFFCTCLKPCLRTFQYKQIYSPKSPLWQGFFVQKVKRVLIVVKGFCKSCKWLWLLNKKFILKQLKVVKVKETDNHKSLRDYWNTLILNIILALGNNVSRNKYNFLMQAQDVARWGGLFVLVFTLA